MVQRTESRNRSARLEWNVPEVSKVQLAGFVGPVVYFIRTRHNLVKIGWTSNLAGRYSAFGSWDCVLAFYKGTKDDEAAEHEKFEEYASDFGGEIFWPGFPLVDRINEIRASLGVPAAEF